MNLPPSSTSDYQSVRLTSHLFLAILAGILAFLTIGCAGPTPGPTDPKEFIYQRRTWTSDSNANAPSPSSDATPPASTPAGPPAPPPIN